MNELIKYIFRIIGLDVRRSRAPKGKGSSGSWNNPPSPIMHSMIHPRATFSPWLGDKEFYAIYERIKNHTMVDIYRLYELYNLAKSTISTDGDILEVGVWRGGLRSNSC